MCVCVCVFVRVYVRAWARARQVHYHGFMHRDVKSLNVFMTKNFTARISDFGFATADEVRIPPPPPLSRPLSLQQQH